LGSRLRLLRVWVFRDLGCGAIAPKMKDFCERLSVEEFWGRVRSLARFRGRLGVGLRSQSSNRAAKDSQMPPQVLSLSHDIKMFSK